MSKMHECLCPCCGKLTGLDSDPSWVCPVCGYPDLVDVGREDIFEKILKSRNTMEFIKESKFVREKYLDKTNPAFSQEWYDKREADDQRILEESKKREKERLEYERKQAQEEARYVPRCPTCGSPHVFNRGNGAGKDVYGLMVHKQYVCNNCGYEW